MRPLTEEQRKLVSDNLSLATWNATRWIRRGGPQAIRYADDIHQEAKLGLVRAALAFKPGLGRFSVYATGYMNGVLRAFCAAMFSPVVSPQIARTNRFRFVGSGLALDTPGLRLPPVDAATTDHADGVKVRAMLSARLPPRLADFFWSREFAGESGDVIGARYGVSRERVRQGVNKARPVFEAMAMELRQEAA